MSEQAKASAEIAEATLNMRLQSDQVTKAMREQARTSHEMTSVGSSKNGSMRAESASGISSMSDASMPFQPAIEEPSKACPSLNLLSSNCFAGTVHSVDHDRHGCGEHC